VLTGAIVLINNFTFCCGGWD